jgi:hypothetical protein
MVIYEIQSDIEAIEKDPALYAETNFDSRAEAIDFIEFDIIDRIEGLFQTIDQPEELAALKQSAERLKRQLEQIDDRLFQRIRADIQTGVCTGTALKVLIDQYVGCDASSRRQLGDIGYDRLDVFINGLLLTDPIPVETKDREPEMVFYQQTPARIILELIQQANLTDQDVFYDLGSGLGQVPILVNLISGASARGVEFEPAYCDYARACAAELNLSRVEFMNVDARAADYSEGTVFFMYTPFEGRLLQEVLEKLHREAHRRKIRLFTYGPCTPIVAQQHWLMCVDQHGDQLYKLGIFRACPEDDHEHEGTYPDGAEGAIRSLGRTPRGNER